ncbi:hypothetical protein JOQ06_002659 [Pogonophryne albipinna]|uniref:Uncharacterized protein n=1 Tax=Pogonophryne albipinna TaxID=1090488 RepID=A0AAD6B4T7_9TELE|nr:hypothetical protein JOQ06_002659 [Pogonophryne albipinna]
MVALNCRLNGEDNHRDAELIWTSPPSQEMDQTPNISSAEQRNRDLLVHGRSLVILNATANHQGNYSCSLGNTSSQLWFRLRVCTKQSRGCEQRSRYPHPCHSQEACPLNCPDVNTPAVTLNITSNGVIWYKEGESTPKASYFSTVEEKDHGVYTCTRSYLYYGSPKVIDCKALMYSDSDEVFWFSTDSFVETNSSFPVFYNYTKERNDEEINMTASLVFKKVSDEDLLKNYTCKLQTVAGPSTSVTISLSQKRVCVRSPTEIYVKAGEMVALNCSLKGEDNHRDAELIWTSPPSQEMDQTPNMSSAEQRNRDLLVHGRSLVILNATANHQGNYSCSLGNTSSQLWFRLRVCTKQSRGCEQRSRYPHRCHSQEACPLNCPDVNTPAVTLNITSNGVIWYKEGESTPKASYFSTVEEKDHGVYTCTRSYLYYERLRLPPVIISPKSGVIHVNLGSPKVIDCKALMYSDSDEVFWFSTDSFVETNSSFPVFYNYTKERNGDGINMTASLVFKKVSYEDLLKKYTCKLQTVTGPSTFVTISLFQKPRPSYIPLALGIVSIVLVTVLTVVIYVKFKITITLLLRDTLGCHSSTSDEKSYDAFLMCYKSDTGLNEDDRMCLESVLEERLGYSLCLYDRDVLPGKAVAEAVLDCIEESRTVLLVPSSPDTGPGSGLLSAIHAALVERQTRLVFIKTEKTEVLRSGSFPEALQILSEAGACVTWKGMRSMPPSSPFWKQLRYHLPAPQHASKIRLLPQTSQDVPSNV